jgi:hypothetical protein
LKLLQQFYEQIDDAAVQHEQSDTKMIHVVTAKGQSVPVLWTEPGNAKYLFIFPYRLSIVNKIV